MCMWFPFSFLCVEKITEFGIVRGEREDVVNKEIIRVGIVKARVLTGEEKTARVTSCLTVGGVL